MRTGTNFHINTEEKAHNESQGKLVAPKTPQKMSRDGPRAYITMVSQPNMPPLFAQKTLAQLAEAEQKSLTSAKKRP